MRVMVTLAAGRRTAAPGTRKAPPMEAVGKLCGAGGRRADAKRGVRPRAGVAVVCAGGGSAAVAARVTEIVAVLTDVAPPYQRIQGRIQPNEERGETYAVQGRSELPMCKPKPKIRGVTLLALTAVLGAAVSLN